jgi:hypothetical protein
MFHIAREFEPEQRSAFLREKCADPVVRQEIGRLVHDHDEVDNLMSFRFFVRAWIGKLWQRSLQKSGPTVPVPTENTIAVEEA